MLGFIYMLKWVVFQDPNTNCFRFPWAINWIKKIFKEDTPSPRVVAVLPVAFGRVCLSSHWLAWREIFWLILNSFCIYTRLNNFLALFHLLLVFQTFVEIMNPPVALLSFSSLLCVEFIKKIGRNMRKGKINACIQPTDLNQKFLPFLHSL